MSSKRYTEELKIEAIKQVTERGHPAAEVAGRLGISIHSLYAWQKRFGKPAAVRHAEADDHAEVHRLKAELRRVTEERERTRPAFAGLVSRCIYLLCDESAFKRTTAPSPYLVDRTRGTGDDCSLPKM